MNAIEVDSPIGKLTLFASDEALVEVHMERMKRAAPPQAPYGSTPLLERAAEQLAEYFGGKRQAFEVPLAPRGTPFQLAVWQALREIPFGATRSYAAIAERIGKPKAVRAVGAANGQNPLSVIIPCHRVIGADGSLTGYGGGLPRKEWLLAHEQVSGSSTTRGRRQGRPAGQGL